MTGSARRFNNLTGAVAGITGRSAGKCTKGGTLRSAHGTGPFTDTTGFHRCTLCRTGALTLFTGLNPVNFYGFFTAESGFFKRKYKIGAEIVTLLRRIAARGLTCRPAAKEAVENCSAFSWSLSDKEMETINAAIMQTIGE